MEWLGHSSVSTSLDRYGHLFPSLDQSLTTGLEETREEALVEISRTFRGPEVIDLNAASSTNSD